MTFANPPPPPPRHCLHFPSKFELFPLWILPKVSVINPFGFSVTTDPPFCSPKSQVLPQNPPAPPPPPPQAINNDRSLNRVTPNRLEANRVAIYKCGRWFEPWTIENKSSQRSGWDLNSRFPNCKSSALMAQSRCLLSSISWETAHLPLP